VDIRLQRRSTAVATASRANIDEAIEEIAAEVFVLPGDFVVAPLGAVFVPP
jgi:hypothetical protein